MSKLTVGRISLPPSGATDDKVMQKVIGAQAEIANLRREVKTLKKDRDDMLAEYTAMRTARPVKPANAKRRTRVQSETVRIYAGDLHGMRMDRECVAAFLRDVKTINPDEIILGGDMLECGGHLARHHTIGYIATCDYSYQEDIGATNWFLDELQKAAPSATIEYLEGNHEHRVERWCVDEVAGKGRDAEFLRAVYGPAALLRLKERGIPYYGQADVHGEGLTRGWVRKGNMLLAHNMVQGKNAAVKAVAKAGYNITYFHTHSYDASPRVLPMMGLVMAFCPGCLCEMQPMWQHSDPTEWNQGYDIDFITAKGNFQRVHVPIWRGESLAGAMIQRFRK